MVNIQVKVSNLHLQVACMLSRGNHNNLARIIYILHGLPILVCCVSGHAKVKICTVCVFLLLALPNSWCTQF